MATVARLKALILAWARDLRGIKESITVLLPIFLGFFVSHAYVIAHGIHAHREAIPRLFDAMVAETHSISLEHGWLFIAAILLPAYSLGGGALWVQRMFPGHYKDSVFLCAGEVDAQNFYGQAALQSLRYRIENTLRYFTVYCHRHGFAATARSAYGADPSVELERLAAAAMDEFPHSVCFAAKSCSSARAGSRASLHNQTALSVQRLLNLQGRSMVIIPLKI